MIGVMIGVMVGPVSHRAATAETKETWVDD